MKRGHWVALLLIAACSRASPDDVILCGSAQGEPSERVRACDSMLALYEENSRGYGSVLTWRAQAKEQAGDAAGAVADYERALGAWPDAPNALLGLGRLYLAQSDLASAQRYLRRSIEVHDSGIASDMLGAYFLQIGDNELALREYEAWLARHPDASSALYGRGVARLRLGDERGREDIEQARTSDARVEPHYAERGIVPP